MPTNGFSIKPLKVKLFAGQQKATEQGCARSPGRLHVSFGEAKLVPDKTLREQISDCAACASFTFARPCLADAWSAVQTGEELEFSLEGITKLWFGEGFDHSLRGVILPESLQCLTFGDQSLDGVTLPSSLQCLTLGKLCAFSSQDVVLPAGLKTLTLGDHPAGRRPSRLSASDFDPG